MTDAALRGVSWGHRRATAPPMEAAAKAFHDRYGRRIEWDVQPLAGFEHAFGPDLARTYDLVVFDHPFCGAIAQAGLLRSLPEILPGQGHALAPDDFIGGSLSSYQYEGCLWGLPVDGATQTAIWRPDLLEAPPETWDDMLALGARERAKGRRLSFAARTPHAFLVLLALCANLGSPLAATPRADVPFDPATLREAMDCLQALWGLSDPRGFDWNAIDLHEVISGGVGGDPGDDTIAFAPITYHYLTYAENDIAARLRFTDFAGPGGDPVVGTVLGGAGLGITTGCRDVEAASAFLGMLADADGQREWVCGHHGQPASRAAWDDAASDTAFQHARRDTRSSVTKAWVRPRFAEYIPFQHECGDATVGWLAGDVDDAVFTDQIADLWRRHAGMASQDLPSICHDTSGTVGAIIPCPSTNRSGAGRRPARKDHLRRI